MKATHLIKVWFLDNFPEGYTDEMVHGVIIGRFDYLGDKLERVEVENLSHGEKENSMIDMANPRMEKLVKSHMEKGGKK